MAVQAIKHMHNFKKKFRQLLFYGGLEKDQYRAVSTAIDESNRKSLIILSFSCSIVYLLRLCLRYSTVSTSNKIIFATATVMFGFLAISNTLIRNDRTYVHLSAYAFLYYYLTIGICSSVTNANVQERTTLYLVFVSIGPMLYALNAIELAIIVLPSELFYLFLIAKFQSNYPVYTVNKGNSLFFSITGLLLGIYMANQKISGIYHSYMNAKLEKIQELNEQLEDSHRELEIALASAEHANRAKTTFLNNMSHDIRTPMNAIIGFTSLATTHINNTEQVQDYLSKIMTSSQHLLSLINDVLDMSRIESGTMKIEEKTVFLPELMHNIRTITQAGISAKQIDFYIDTEDVVNETVITDSLRLNQILLNILSNSIKFTPTGGRISLRVIQKTAAPEGFADYKFIIRDNGIGMSKEFQEHIFEAFARESSSTVSGIQGTGLGMAITKNIVDMMHGTIRVNSTEKIGSEFIVSLRFAVTKDSFGPEPIPALEGSRALIADDDTDACRSVSKMLHKIGMRPEWTISGKEAVLRAEDALEMGDEFSLYIIDWLMPDMNGIETVRRIRRVIGEQKPIIILTAYDWADIEEEAREAGVTAFCSKPLFLSELHELLSKSFYQAASSDDESSDSIHSATSTYSKGASEGFSGRRILLVEDNPLNQEIATAILNDHGFIVDTAADGVEAVDRMRAATKADYDLILMDIQMPTMNGYIATMQIRALDNPVCTDIPIIAMTANAFEEDRQAALAAGMNDYITKPIDIAALMDILHRELA